MPKSIYKQVNIILSTSMLQQNSELTEHMLFFNLAFQHVAGFPKDFKLNLTNEHQKPQISMLV